MLRNNVRAGGVQNANERGPERVQKLPRLELKVSAKVASPECFLLQYTTGGATDVTIWSKRFSVV